MGSNGRKQYSVDFKREAVALVTQQGYTLVAAARNLGIHRDMLRRWKGQVTRDGTVAFPGKGWQTPEQAELHRLREENRRLRMERDRGRHRPERNGPVEGVTSAQVADVNSELEREGR